MERFKLIVYAIILVVAISCHRKQKSKPLPPLSVEVATASAKPIFNHVDVATQINALRNVVIQPRIDGFLNSINFTGGGTPIKRGSLLFVIEPNEYNYALLAAKANLESALAQEKLAQSNYLRAIPLAEIDAISQSDLDQYRATHSAAQASVKSTQEALNSAELNVSYTKIYAPIDGIIAETAANEGDYIGPSTAISSLTTISYTDTVEVEVPIPTALYLQSDGSLSDITLTLSGAEIYGYEGEYYYTLKDSPTASSTVAVMVKFPNPEQRLRPGMFGRVRANIGEAKECVVVPQIAVNQNQGINSVWIMLSDSTVKFTEVTLGNTTGEDWVIESGVKEGDVVLTSGQLKVHNGAKVLPTKR